MNGSNELGQELGLSQSDFERLQVSDSDLEMVTGGVGAAFDEAMLAGETTIISSTTIIRDQNASEI